MRFNQAAFAASLVVSALAHPGSPHPDAEGRYTLEAEGIKAQFIPYAATLTNLWVKGMHLLPTQTSRLLTSQQVRMEWRATSC
jgi:hypothetical protein